MTSPLISFLLIILTVLCFCLLAYPLKKMFSNKAQEYINLSHALDSLFVQKGNAKYSVKHMEILMLLFFLWLFLGVFAFAFASLESLSKEVSIGFLSVFSLCTSLWWAWRKGILD